MRLNFHPFLFVKATAINEIDLKSHGTSLAQMDKLFRLQDANASILQCNTVYQVLFCRLPSSGAPEQQHVETLIKTRRSSNHPQPGLSTLFDILDGWIHTHGKDCKCCILLLNSFLIRLISSDILQVLSWLPQQFISKSPRSPGIEKVENCSLTNPPLHNRSI